VSRQKRPAAPRNTGWKANAYSSPWWDTFEILHAAVWRRMLRIIMVTITLATLGAAGRFLVPPSYVATSQVLFDPRGLKVFSNELTAGYYDANSAISFVESQMGVLQSERVHSRIVTMLCDGSSLPQGVARPSFCPAAGSTRAMDSAVNTIKRSITVRRSERSFLVDINATSSDPQLSAAIASATVAAYQAEDAATRTDVANRLTADLGARSTNLRKALKDSEERADQYRNDRNLIRVGDRLLVEQRLAAATTALNESQTRLDRIGARARQIDLAPRRSGYLAVLGSEPETRALQGLLERRNSFLVEMAPLAARAGDRHPAMIELRSRLSEINRSIAIEVAQIRESSHADLSRAQTEQDSLAATVADLSVKVAQARRAEAELKVLDQETESNRKLLESFETRAREAREFSKVDVGNLRIVSVARAPETRNMVPHIIAWGFLGAILGLILSIATTMIAAGIGMAHASYKRRKDYREAVEKANPVYSMRMKAEAFARYRYG